MLTPHGNESVFKATVNADGALVLSNPYFPVEKIGMYPPFFSDTTVIEGEGLDGGDALPPILRPLRNRLVRDGVDYLNMGRFDDEEPDTILFHAEFNTGTLEERARQIGNALFDTLHINIDVVVE